MEDVIVPGCDIADSYAPIAAPHSESLLCLPYAQRLDRAEAPGYTQATATQSCSSSLGSGCDSSSCVYCQGTAHTPAFAGLIGVLAYRGSTDLHPQSSSRLQDAASRCQSSPELCTLQTMHSADRPATAPRPRPAHLTAGDGVTPLTEDCKSTIHSRACEPEPLCSSKGGRFGGMAALAGEAPTHPWRCCPSYESRPDPVPSVLVEVASFGPMEHAARQRNIVCGLDFADSGHVFATAGVNKQLAVYSLLDYWQRVGDDGAARPMTVHRLPSKLSCLAWSPTSQGLATVGDYDGGVYQVDIASGHYVADIDEHDGRRVLCVAHSRAVPGLCASTAEDGTACLMAGHGLRDVVARIAPAPGFSVCGADFCAEAEQLLALACADSSVYLYDLRHLQAPLLRLTGHQRAVSYAKFVGPSRLVSASIDATLAAWDLPTRLPPAQPWAPLAAPVRTFAGHTNSKNFVGLAVRPANRLLATGSESASVYVYRTSWEAPLASAHVCGDACEPGEFVSAVAWQAGDGPHAPLLAAATSEGRVKLLALRLRAED